MHNYSQTTVSEKLIESLYAISLNGYINYMHRALCIYFKNEKEIWSENFVELFMENII